MAAVQWMNSELTAAVHRMTSVHLLQLSVHFMTSVLAASVH